MSSELWVIYVGNDDVYCTIVQEATNYIYDVNSMSFVEESIDDWGGYAIDLHKTNEDMHTADFPTAPNGFYRIVYRVKSEGSSGELAANISDIVLKSERVNWSGRLVSPDGPGGVNVPVLSDYAIVDLNQTKRYLNLDYFDTQKDWLLIDIINYITSRMEKIADRKFKARNYKEKYFTNKGNNIILRNWPVKYVKRVASGTQIGMTLTHSGTELRVTVGGITGDRAAEQTGEQGLVIQSIDSVGVETVTEIDFKTYPTVQLVADRINSVITNVTAVVNQNAPSLDVWNLTNVAFTNGSATIDILNSDDIAYNLNADVGAIEIGSAPEWIIVEYRGGFEGGASATPGNDEETEFYYNQNVALDCIRMVYNLAGKDTALKSNQFDQGEVLNIQTYYSEAEIDQFITDKIRVTGDFALAD